MSGVTRFARLIGPLLVAIVGLPIAAALAVEVSPRLDSALHGAEPELYDADGRLAIWIFFSDKNVAPADLPAALEDARSALTSRALARRAKLERWRDRPVDVTDLPIAAAYREAVEATGATIRRESRWLDAVSCNATPAQIETLRELPFVRRLALVARTRRDVPGPAPASEPEPAVPAPRGGHLYDYGNSFGQMDQIRVPEVHDEGYTGAGVVIGMLDSGFDTSHSAFDSLLVLAVYDFVNDDPVVEDEPGDPDGADHHGSETLSNVAAFLPGGLIAPAFGASVVLAKTEDIGDEQPIEEDWWVAGLEWVEAQGADIVSSSLSYLDWYTWPDMDGDTAVTTVAADLAAGRGLVVVNSAGNQREDPWGHISAPADGDSVIAVGAVYSTGTYAYFSSPGPSYDGRIKPDVMAQGRSNTVIDPNSVTALTTASGTSFSCPLVAGVAALLLERIPVLTPIQIRDALRETASQAAAPDNDYGWGIIDAYEALHYYEPHFAHEPLRDTEDTVGPYDVDVVISDHVPLVPASFQLTYRVNGGSWIDVPLMPQGAFQHAVIPGQIAGSEIEYYLSAENSFAIAATWPAGAPAQVLAFAVGPDGTPPDVTHTPVPDWAESRWPAIARALVADNVGVASVDLTFDVNGAAPTVVPMVPEGDGWYRGAFALAMAPAAGDSVHYQITATDLAGVPNVATAGPHAFEVGSFDARVLVVDDAAGGTSPGTIAAWLGGWNYAVDVVSAAAFSGVERSAYQAIALSGGNNDAAIADPGLRAALSSWMGSGGRLFVEGGEVGALAFNYYPEFLATVLRSTTWYGGQVGSSTIVPEQATHPVLTSPHVLPNSLAIFWQNYASQDAVRPANDADLLMRTFFYPGAAGLTAYDDNLAPQAGQMVYLPVDITRVTNQTTAAHLVENAFAWFFADEPPPGASIAGTVDLLGAPDDGGVEVTAGPWSALTSGDGSYSLPSMYGGDWTVRAWAPGYEVGRVPVALGDTQQLTGIDLTLRPTAVTSATDVASVPIPGSNPLGIDRVITVGPEHAGETVGYLEVSAVIEHLRTGDLTVTLSSPSGTLVVLTDRTGGNTPDIVGTWPTTLDVDGPGTLDDFLGEPIVGDWTLNVADHVAGVSGTLETWTLDLFIPTAPTDTPWVGAPTYATSLLPSVPNPFREETTVRFSLARRGPVSLDVFDVQGRRVRSLVSGPVDAGRHQAVWDGRDSGGQRVASGVYFVRLDVAGGAKQRKVLRIR
ncbi:MAG: S8 family serine peptidase [bacterium]